MTGFGSGQRVEAASAYLAVLASRQERLELLPGRRLRLPPNYTDAEKELVRLLKPELIALLEQEAQDLRDERAAILEYEAGMDRAEAEGRAGLPIVFTRDR